MAHPKADKEKWVLLYIETQTVRRFSCEENARIAALEATAPVSLIAPIYREA